MSRQFTEDAPPTASVTLPRVRIVESIIPIPHRPRGAALAVLVVATALWGLVVDSPFIPLLRPTGNSTLFQSTTAAAFALLGILFGPLAGALGGLVRDGIGPLATILLHPGMVTHPGFLAWLARAVVDTLEDVVLGWVPGLLAVRTQRVLPLAAASAAAAWLSLPFLVAGTTLFSDHPNQIWLALTTRAGDWNEPVDPGLTVYALLTGALVALALARWTTRPRISLEIALLFAAPAVLLIALGAHP
ncbi:MAG TPA: hypothetical protein VKQ30_05370 [Ktedonobacterales bacterium]|nr:hypothetical protein [Ktedonobacterales bacterium]